MRSRASGLGARISSMVLGIILSDGTHHRFDECDLVGAQSILFVKLLIRPSTIHFDIGDESEPLTVEVMSVSAQPDEEPDELRPKIAGEIGCLGFRLKSIGD